MKKIVVVALFALLSMQANAWGDREQGILVGIASAMVLQHIHQANKNRDRTVYDQGPVVIQRQPPVVIQQQPPIVITQQQPPVYTDRPLNCVSRPVLYDPYTGRPVRFETRCQ